MPARRLFLPPKPAWAARASRFFSRWWRRLPPSRQDRLATIGPLISVLLFLAAIAASFWTLRNEWWRDEDGWMPKISAERRAQYRWEYDSDEDPTQWEGAK